MGVSTEEVGLGFITYKFDTKLLDSLNQFLGTGINAQEFMNAVIRVLGDFYRYKDPDGFVDEDDKKIENITALRKVFAHYLIKIKGEPKTNVYGRNGGLTGDSLIQLCKCVQNILSSVSYKDAYGNTITPFYHTTAGNNVYGIQLPFEYLLFHRTKKDDE